MESLEPGEEGSMTVLESQVGVSEIVVSDSVRQIGSGKVQAERDGRPGLVRENISTERVSPAKRRY